MTHQGEMTAYEKFLDCCGGICGCLCCTYKRLTSSEIGLMEKFGKFEKSCEAGLNYYNPIT